MSDLGRILVPVDFSPFSKAALALAIRLSDRDSLIEVLHAWDAICEPDRSVVTRKMKDFLAPFASADVAFHAVIEAGDPYVRIAIAAGLGEFSLIVMGTHGQSQLVHLRMGSVAEQVAQHAPCPVLTVDAPRGGAADEIPPWLPRDPLATVESVLVVPKGCQVDRHLLAKIDVVCPNTQRVGSALACLECPDFKFACLSSGAGQLELICHRSPLTNKAAADAHDAAEGRTT